jgi:curved DNA-binding protein CbpA
MKNYYDLLGVSETASQEEIKQAYRLLSQKFHPDKNDGNAFFEEMFKNINESYSTLGDITSRKKYDESLLFITDGNANIDTSEYDPLLSDAIANIIINNQASASLLQRKLKLGYNRTERLIIQIENLNIISKPDNNNQRRILVDKYGVVNVLAQNNFPTKNFLESFELYTPKIEQQVYTNYSNKKTSEWDVVKRWKNISYLFWALNVCLILFVFLVHKKSSSNISNNTEKSSNIGRVISIKGLNMRANSNSNSDIIISIPYNQEVIIIDENGPLETINSKNENWYNIKYKNLSGWVWGGYIN